MGQQNVAFQVVSLVASGLFLPHATQVRLAELSTKPSHSHLTELLGTFPSHSILLFIHPTPAVPGPGAVTHQCRTHGLCAISPWQGRGAGWQQLSDTLGGLWSKDVFEAQPSLKAPEFSERVHKALSSV